MPAEGVFRLARRRFTVVLTVLEVVFGVVLSLVVGLAVNAVPKSWGWAHNWWLLIGIGAGLLVAAALVAVVQVRSSPGGEEKAARVVRVGTVRWSPVAGSNTGLMIGAKKVINKKVIIGAAGTAVPGKDSPASVVQRQGADDGERAGDTLPLRNAVFTGRDDMLAEVGRRLDAGPVAVVAV
jgi:MFS family permease